MKHKPTILRISTGVGALAALLSLLLRGALPDFRLGFLEGMALVLMGIGLIGTAILRQKEK